MPKRLAKRDEMWFERKLAMPPAQMAPEFAQDFQNSQGNQLSPEDKRVAQSQLYTRGYDWETIPENIQRLHAMNVFPLKQPLKVHTWDKHSLDDQGLFDQPWDEAWDQMGGAVYHNPGGKYHQIGLHPFSDVEETNKALWHELQHAYQREEGRTDPDRNNDWSNENYMQQPEEMDAEDMARVMHRYPLVRKIKPEPDPQWFPNEFHNDYGGWNDQLEWNEAPLKVMHEAIGKWRNPNRIIY
jgi:hypothetical protein